MQSANDLKQLLFNINHKSYPAYKSARGAYQFPNYILSIDHVQGDPFAAPSRVSIHVTGKTAAFPPSLYDTYEKRIALQGLPAAPVCTRNRTVFLPCKGIRQKRTAWRKPLRSGDSRAHRLCFQCSKRQPGSQHGNRFSCQRPHHCRPGADPHSLRLSTGLR